MVACVSRQTPFRPRARKRHRRPSPTDAATRAIRTTRDKIKFLARHPRLGRVDSDERDCRELLIPFGDSGYVARYRLDGETVVILAVRHAREAGYYVEG
ncbi:MAG: type II toxin-antitoxin system RelE/ParE family toxin [Proteobacteria bacterium]|nr:type II toxin-antitoxin system RelE/ParE family toxin [Pseudomonadota bacterium]